MSDEAENRPGSVIDGHILGAAAFSCPETAGADEAKREAQDESATDAATKNGSEKSDT